MKKINIGDNNEIKNNNFGTQINNGDNNEVNNKPSKTQKENWIRKHPYLISFLISLIAGFILLFSFWENLVVFIEGLF